MIPSAYVDRLTNLLRRPIQVYVLLLYGLSVFYLIRWPVIAGDTDLWYHLTGGRYLFEHHAIPHDSFFSFLSPPRAWVDYYWLFQVVVWLVYSGGGYLGLVVFRSTIYLVTVGLVFAYLSKGQERQASSAWWAFIAVLCGLLLIPRSLLIRPHLFTYAFIVAFLYLLEYRPRGIVLLPALAVFWCNLHGVAYPVMWWMLMAYGAERLLNHLRGSLPRSKDEQKTWLWIGLSMLAVFLTPHGARLLRVPFVSTASASDYIMELTPLSPFDLVSFRFSLLASSYDTIFSAVFLATCFAALASLSRSTVRLSHLLLCLGGVVLLGKGLRFTVEFALIALPLLKANPPVRPGLLIGRIPKRVYLPALSLLMLMPMSVVVRHFTNRPAYPFSPQGLPQGVAAFLNHVDVGGRVLNDPNNGGYLQWRLYPRYRIFMDMEVPFLFTDEDMYLAHSVFTDAVALGKMLSRYDPAFITVRNTTTEFPTLIKQFPEYVMVWFDDAEVLYVNQRQHQALAAAYKLDALNPFSLPQESVDTILKSDRDQAPAMQELHRLLAISPDGHMTNHLAGLIYLRDGAHDRVLPHAEAIITRFPESPVGYRLRGDALKGLRAFDQALAAYRLAMERSDSSHQIRLHKEIGLVYFEQGRYPQAYEALAHAINLFSGNHTVEDLYRFGSAALRAGKPRQAKPILTYLARYKLSPNQTTWTDTLKQDLARLGVEATIDGGEERVGAPPKDGILQSTK